MSQRFRQTMKGLVNLQIETSSGSPEGRLAAKSGKLYQDTNNTVDGLDLYLKRFDSVDGDSTAGWSLVSAHALFTQLQITTGVGSPEGVLSADQTKLYLDTANTIAGGDLYIKTLDSVLGDDSLGWALVSGKDLSATGDKLVETDVDYVLVAGNQIISCSNDISIVLDGAADDDLITITSTSGTVVLGANLPIQSPTTITTGTTATLYKARNQWWHA